MTADIVNLRQRRKRAARAERERTAEENRVRFGESHAAKASRKKVVTLEDARLDGARRDTE